MANIRHGRIFALTGILMLATMCYGTVNAEKPLTVEEWKNFCIERDGPRRWEVYEEFKAKHGVSNDTKAVQKLDRIMTRLSNIVANYDSTIYSKPYLYFVSNRDALNARCTLGHVLKVDKGMFNALGYHEDELAFVVAHEMSHGTHGDPLNNALDDATLANVKDNLSKDTNPIKSTFYDWIYDYASKKGIELPVEKRADADAFNYCVNAGYNPGAGAAYRQRLIEKKGFLDSINIGPSNHPEDKERLEFFGAKLTEYSRNHVKVDASNGDIIVNDVKVGRPSEAFSQSSKERAYIVAGDMARAFRDCSLSELKAQIADGQVWLGAYPVLTITDNDDGKKWVEQLNIANGFEKQKEGLLTTIRKHLPW